MEETCSINAQCTTVGVTNNYRENKGNYCTVYRLPAVLEERQKWINALPYFNLSHCELSNFRVSKALGNKLSNRDEVCCQKQLMSILSIINSYYDFGFFPHKFLRRMSIVQCIA